MMTKIQIENNLRRSWLPFMKDMGQFEKERLIYLKKGEIKSEILLFGGRMSRKMYYFTFSVAVRFSVVEKIYCEAGESDETSPTLLAPIHLLHKDRRYFEWSISNIDQIPDVVELVRKEILEYALPFFEKYSTLEAIRKSLLSDNPLDRYCLDPDGRLLLLIAIYYAEGEKGRALEMVKQELVKRKGMMPKDITPFEDLYRRMTS